MFTSILNQTTGEMTITNTLLCMAVAVVLGFLIAFTYKLQSAKYSKNFIITLVLLPILVQVVIMMVNGNLGTSVAILGAFSLVRFRSAPGSSKEICAVFFAMAVGLATGMGYLIYAIVFTVIVAAIFTVLNLSNFGGSRTGSKVLRITIPESLDYTEVFDDIFDAFTSQASLEKVKTTNMGSMYELSYHISLKDDKEEKKMIDEIRCRNGNLIVICGRKTADEAAL